MSTYFLKQIIDLLSSAYHAQACVVSCLSSEHVLSTYPWYRVLKQSHCIYGNIYIYIYSVYICKYWGKMVMSGRYICYRFPCLFTVIKLRHDVLYFLRKQASNHGALYLCVVRSLNVKVSLYFAYYYHDYVRMHIFTLLHITLRTDMVFLWSIYTSSM